MNVHLCSVCLRNYTLLIVFRLKVSYSVQFNTHAGRVPGYVLYIPIWLPCFIVLAVRQYTMLPSGCPRDKGIIDLGTYLPMYKPLVI